MKLKKIYNLSLLLGLGIITYSCNLEYFDNAELEEFTFNPSLAVAIGEVNYKVSDLFAQLDDPNVVIEPNSDNVVTLSYVEELSGQSASEFITISDQGFTGSVPAGTTNIAAPIATTVSVSETLIYDLALENAQEFDSVFFNGGNFVVDITSGIQSDVNFTLTVRSLVNKVSGLPLVATGVVSQSNTTFNDISPLTEYKGVFSNDGSGGVSFNKVLIDVVYDISIAVGDNLNATDKLDFAVNFVQPEFEQIFGFVGRTNLDLSSQTIDLDFFNSFGEGTIRFAEPKFIFSFDNGYGFPIGIDFQNVSATDANGMNIDLTGAVTESVQIVNAPTVEQSGQSVQTNITLESSNSNIAELMSSKPSTMTFDIAAQTNPPTGPVQFNYLNATSFLEVDVQLEIPLYIGIDNLSTEEALDFSNIESLDQVESAMLRVIVDNGIPLSGNIEVIFMNGSNPVYTISDRPLFDAPAVGNDGRVSADAQSLVDIEIDQAGITAISNANQILLRVTVNTTGASSGDNVRLFDDYELNVKLAMQAKLNVSSGN